MNIEIKNFEFRWQGTSHPLLKIPRWSIPRGHHTLIWGESGKGKTTLLHCIAGLLDATDGDIKIEGVSYREMRETDRQKLRKFEITMIFQRLNLLKHLTALENVMLGSNGRHTFGKQTALHALDRVGMTTAAHRFAWKLSAGEQQRVALARALLRQTPLLLADEPTANLDEANAKQAIHALLSDAQQHQQTLLVVSHDERIRPLFRHTCNIEELSTL